MEVTSGTWIIEAQEVDGEHMQVMKWYHHQGEQSMTVKGVKRKLGIPGASVEEDEAGYFETMRKTGDKLQHHVTEIVASAFIFGKGHFSLASMSFMLRKTCIRQKTTFV